MVHFILFIFFFFSQRCQWSHQSDLGWNGSIQIVLIKPTKKKQTKKEKKLEKCSKTNKTFILVIFLKTIWLDPFQPKSDWWLHWHLCEKKKNLKRKKRTIYKSLLFCFFFCFPFIVVILIKTIWLEPFQLQLDWWIHWQLCEKKKERKERNEPFIKLDVLFVLEHFSSFFSFLVCFFLVGFIKTIWMERFQPKSDWWLHWHLCEKKKRREWNEPFLKFGLFFFFIFFFLVGFIKTIWMEPFQLKLGWWHHWHLCEKKRNRKMNVHKIGFYSFKKKFSFSFLFPFILVILIKIIWMEPFQLKLDWWIYWHLCKKKKEIEKEMNYS